MATDDSRPTVKGKAADRVDRFAFAGESLAATGRRLNNDPTLLTIVRSIRAVLPGDGRIADPDELGARRQPKAVGRVLAEISTEQPGVLGEAGLGALQIWEAVSEAQGRGRGRSDLAIVFTDLVAFSDWALEAGDRKAVDLLRDVSVAIEPPVKENGGTVVKRLGDGMMAVFKDPAKAIAAIAEGRENLAEIEAYGYSPQIRAGIHVGRPRKVGSDYFGVDVNIAARLADTAGASQLLISDATLESLGDDAPKVSKRPQLKAKGVPDGVRVFAVAP